MTPERSDELIQKYLSNKTTRKEEKELLDSLLKGTNQLISQIRKNKQEVKNYGK